MPSHELVVHTATPVDPEQPHKGFDLHIVPSGPIDPRRPINEQLIPDRFTVSPGTLPHNLGRLGITYVGSLGQFPQQSAGLTLYPECQVDNRRAAQQRKLGKIADHCAEGIVRVWS